MADAHTWHGGRLTDAQSALIAGWLPDPRLRADMSWNLVDMAVLDVDSESGRFVVKAAGPHNHHLTREVAAFQGFTDCLADAGYTSRLLHHDLTANLLVLEYLPGSLVMGSDAEFTPRAYRQAGVIARTFHGQAERTDPGWEAAAVTKSLGWLDKTHRISDRSVVALRAILTGHRPRPVTVVPTHGDWQPRNWLIDDEGTVKVIDFGRFAWRPAVSDFCRLAAQQWREDRRLEEAFFTGYGGDPRSPDQWRMFAIHEAIGTAAWAYQVGDEPFEQQGHRMIEEALELF